MIGSAPEIVGKRAVVLNFGRTFRVATFFRVGEKKKIWYGGESLEVCWSWHMQSVVSRQSLGLGLDASVLPPGARRVNSGGRHKEA